MDKQLKDLAKSSTNFGRLYGYNPLLSIYGAQAEAIVFSDANGALVHVRQFGEVLAQELITRTGLRVEGDRQVDRLVALARAGTLVPAVRDAFDRLRGAGNDATHRHLFDRVRALESIKIAFDLGLWFHRAMSGDRVVVGFVPPAEPMVANPTELAQLRTTLEGYRLELAESRLRLDSQTDLAQAAERARVEAESMVVLSTARHDEMRAQIDALMSEVSALREAQRVQFETLRQQPRRVSSADREAIVENALRPAPLNEVQARKVIDRMLVEAGWIVQDMRDLNPVAGTGVAVREFRLATGPADYVLYVKGRIVGVIEAKREGESLSAAHAQNTRYAGGVLQEHELAVWHDDEPFPFRYASTGAETSFLNRLDPVPSSRGVFSFHQPATLKRWMDETERQPTAPTYRARLQQMPALDTSGLREAQKEAITNLEEFFGHTKSRGLIQMATGAGKTFTAVTETYRLLKHAKAKRILFLVDRNNLGRQALAEFRNYEPPDDVRKFKDIYNVERLAGTGIQDSSSVVICTIQKMYALLRGEAVVNDDDVDDTNDNDLDAGPGSAEAAYRVERPVEVAYNPDVPPESFDLIIVDECHRSIYGLWRGVLEYFDAHVVGLTATPTKQTLGFFGQNLISEYPYELAVADGVNVDFLVVKLRTKIGQAGSTIEEGTTVKVRNRQTRRQRLELLDDDFTYTSRQLGRSVIAEDQIRNVLSEYEKNWRDRWFPDRQIVPKTLVFAADDNHAEEIVKQVKEVFGQGDDFVQKITYKVRKAGKNPDDLINLMRNNPALRVAVTVDLIATGTDIRPLECVIFMRPVRSAVLFEQMKGRGARTVSTTELREVTPGADENISKTRFILFDAVGVTDSPLVEASPLQAASEKQVSLQKLLERCATRAISEIDAATLAARLSALNIQISRDERDELARVGGITVSDLSRGIVKAIDPDAQDEARQTGGPRAARQLIEAAILPLTSNPEFRNRILEIRRDHDITYDETSQDETEELREESFEERAEKTINTWRGYLEQHLAELVAISALTAERGGGDGAYEAIKEVGGRIRRSPYTLTPDTIWDAYASLGKGAHPPGRGVELSDLVSLIRFERGLDVVLLPYETIVHGRFADWLQRQEQAGIEYTDDQAWWLEAMRDTVASGVGITINDLNKVPFSQRGGPVGLVKAFGGDKERVRALIVELDRELA